MGKQDKTAGRARLARRTASTQESLAERLERIRLVSKPGAVKRVFDNVRGVASRSLRLGEFWNRLPKKHRVRGEKALPKRSSFATAFIALGMDSFLDHLLRTAITLLVPGNRGTLKHDDIILAARKIGVDKQGIALPPLHAKEDPDLSQYQATLRRRAKAKQRLLDGVKSKNAAESSSE